MLGLCSSRTSQNNAIRTRTSSLRGVALDRGHDRGRQEGLAVEEHECLRVQHLLLVHADDDAVVNG